MLLRLDVFVCKHNMNLRTTLCGMLKTECVLSIYVQVLNLGGNIRPRDNHEAKVSRVTCFSYRR